MGNDLPDYQSKVETTLSDVTSIEHGLDADKSATPVAGDAYLATDTGILYVCLVDGAWKGTPVPPNVITQSQPARAIGTTYQNTSETIRVVTVGISSGFLAAIQTVVAYCDSNAAPVTEVARFAASAIGATDLVIATMTFLVPPDYYYKLVREAGVLSTVSSWTEYDLL